ncbi:MAG: DNA polymerase III subunit beta [Thermoguttaceae bacterium]
MKIVFPREKFVQALQFVGSVTPSRDTKEVLHHIKVVADKTGVLLQTTDTEVGLRYHIEDCEVVKPGEALLPTRRTRNVVQEARGETITIESDGHESTLLFDHGKVKLLTPAVEEFPDVEAFSKKLAYYNVSAPALRTIIQHTVFSTDDENARYAAIAGVLLEIDENDVLNAVATDGRRLAYETCQGKPHEGKETKEPLVRTVVVSPKALQILERCLHDEGDVQIATSAHRAIFKCGNVELMTRLIEGNFPKWRRIMPERSERLQIDFVADSLHTAVRQAQVVATEDKPGVVFSFAKGKVTLTAHGSETGESYVELPISFGDTPLKFQVDPKFVREFLRVLDPTTTVSLYVDSNNGEAALLFTVGETYSYVVMPMGM